MFGGLDTFSVSQKWGLGTVTAYVSIGYYPPPLPILLSLRKYGVGMGVYWNLSICSSLLFGMICFEISICYTLSIKNITAPTNAEFN